MIEVHGFSYTYPDQNVPTLIDLSFEVPEGQFCAVIGPNGAGKSTLCYALSGFIPHYYRGDPTGTVRVAGQAIEETSLGDLAGVIGFVFQNPFNQITGSRYTVEEEIAFGLENLGTPRKKMLERVQQALLLTGLEGLGQRSPFELSGGQQQRLALASIFAMQPPVLVLDEPTSQLDPRGTRQVFQTLRNFIKQSKITVVYTGHKLEQIGAVADRVILLQDGRIVADGRPQDVLGSSLLLNSAIQPSRYTLAALAAVEDGFVPNQALLPVTLDQAVRFFR